MPASGHDEGERAPYARSIAYVLRAASLQNASAPSWVARSTTRGAIAASTASRQRGAHRHQRSPGLRPGKPEPGIGVDRSLPRAAENFRKTPAITTHAAALPRA